jgi:pimeloyl-ACP methyl ester carboxylesterase
MRKALYALVLALGVAGAAPAADVDGLDIHSTSRGSGPTIIFVHGWTCDGSSWDAQVPEFAKDYRAITLDLPGHGMSASPAESDFSMALFARAVEAVRAEAGADRVVLVGHSMGVPVIRQYAIMFPQHVAGLVGVDGPFDMRNASPPVAGGSMTHETREIAIRSMFLPTTPAAVQDHVLNMMLAPPDSTANGAFAAMFDPAIRTSDVIRAPALVVIAGTGNVPDAATAHEVVPNLEITQLQGTAHFLMMEKPAEFNRLLHGFLERIDF